MKTGVRFRIAILLTALAAVLVVFAPRVTKFSYDYKKGTVWNYDALVAPFDFPILKTADQINAEREDNSHIFVPYYRCSDEVAARAVRQAEALDFGELVIPIAPVVRDIYEKGVVSDEGIRKEGRGAPSDIFYVQKGTRAMKYPTSEVYKLAQARSALLSALEERVDYPSLDSLLKASGAYELIVPNLFYDAQTTALVDAESVGSLSPTLGFVSAGQLIVSNGELVTAEVAQILDSYKKEYEENIGYSGSKLLYWLGNILLALAIVCVVFFSIYFTDKSVFHDNRFPYIVCVLLICFLLQLLTIRFDQHLLFLVPYVLTALFLQAFMKPSVIVPIYFVSLLPMLVYADSGVMLFTMFLTAGVVAIYSFDALGKGWKQFILALLVFAVLALVYCAFLLLHGRGSDFVRNLVLLFGAAMLQVAFYPLTYLFEKIFNLVSSSRLSELSDTSSPLLRQLEQTSPGTFQHSLQVMNMCDHVARAIDADPLMVRTAALYHDIGKALNPLCFVENESLLNRPADEKYHYGLNPQQSAHDIIKHVGDGVELAQKNHLPQVLTDFIRTHHGTTLTGYFWSAYLKQGGDSSNQEEFRYPGPKPVTKEQIVLMLCDSIEAASRTLSEYTPEAYSAFVERIVNAKMNDGQFDDADISLKEIGIIKETLKSYLAQMHHRRIVYPRKRSNK